MVSRTQAKQQIMRQMVMNEEKAHKTINPSYSLNSYKGVYNGLSQSNKSLPTLSSTMMSSNNNFGYYLQLSDNQNHENFHKNSNTVTGEEFPIFSIDYNEPHPIENTPFITDFNLHSSSIENNNSSHRYHNISTRQVLHTSSSSCPITTEQMSTTSNQQQMNNSESAVVRGSSLYYDDKLTQIKDRSKKESHNRIERKRRDFINHQIQELSTLLPSQMTTDGESKKNKGNILKNSVFYIQQLQSESNNSTSYIKESDLAFMLVENYRQQIQDLKQDSSPRAGMQNITELYEHYIQLHDQNRKMKQSNNNLFVPMNNYASTEMNSRLSTSSYNKSPQSSLDSGSVLKVESCSAHSSISTTYRIDEELDFGCTHASDLPSPNVTTQPQNSNYRPLISIQNDSFTTNNYCQEMDIHSFDYMDSPEEWPKMNSLNFTNF